MKTILYLIIIAMMIFTPISLFTGIPPFGLGNKNTYSYSMNIDTDNFNSKNVTIYENAIVFISSSPIENPSLQGLKLASTNNNDTRDNIWYFGTVIIEIMLSILLMIIYVWEKPTKTVIQT